jgi:hypothetical protein
MIVPEDTLLMDGYDDCLEGICIRFGQDPIAIYDYDKVINKLMEDGLSEVDATEWFEYNMIGAWVGEKTPAFIVKDVEFEYE